MTGGCGSKFILPVILTPPIYSCSVYFTVVTIFPVWAKTYLCADWQQSEETICSSGKQKSCLCWENMSFCGISEALKKISQSNSHICEIWYQVWGGITLMKIMNMRLPHIWYQKMKSNRLVKVGFSLSKCSLSVVLFIYLVPESILE